MIWVLTHHNIFRSTQCVGLEIKAFASSTLMVLKSTNSKEWKVQLSPPNSCSLMHLCGTQGTKALKSGQEVTKVATNLIFAHTWILSFLTHVYYYMNFQLP